jgi:hypothetical protein
MTEITCDILIAVPIHKEENNIFSFLECAILIFNNNTVSSWFKL